MPEVFIAVDFPRLFPTSETNLLVNGVSPAEVPELVRVPIMPHDMSLSLKGRGYGIYRGLPGHGPDSFFVRSEEPDWGIWENEEWVGLDERRPLHTMQEK